MKAIRRFTVRTVLPEPIRPLARLASNLRWSWHRPTRELFAGLNPRLWEESGQDPVGFLGMVSREEFQQLAANRAVVERVRAAEEDLDRYLEEPRWYQGLGPDAPASIAYFSPEFGITEVLPQYSGGLGILAGDHLKAASDLGVPLIGVGLLYQAGYFKQSLSRDAWQQETYPVLDPDGLPLTLLREPSPDGIGRPLQISLPLPNGRRLLAHIWRADVGRVPLLLLDSNVPGNDDAARSITDRLYGGGGDHRLQQELLLGMGGVKALRAFQQLTGTTAPEVFHTNEGHAGFLGIERIQELMAGEQALTFDEALAAGRASTVFTTHTPVPAGIDRFEIAQIHHFFQAGLAPAVPTDRILELGRENYADGNPSVFNMAIMGLRLAQRANGVAKLHGEVSRGMFSALWPGFDHSEVPITSVTNGVHVPTWVDSRISQLARDQFGSEAEANGRWDLAYNVSDADVWALRREMRAALVEDVRRRLRASWKKRGAADAELGWTDNVLDPDILTIGFARRVPTYKRLTLMLREPERLKALLLHKEHPIQLVIAGKSHPADDAGKKMIQDLVRFTDDPEVRHRIAFLPNYDIAMARTLFPGCDVWLNNPLRPLEACGTSGMKAALNGSLNLSVLDGWWDEMYDGENGWAIPTANNGASPEERDDIEAAALYELLETQVAPRFYGSTVSAGAGAAGPSTSGAEKVPTHWVSMIKHTLSHLGPAVSAERMLRDYVNILYRPAAEAGRNASANSYSQARTLAAWTAKVRSAWPLVHVEHVDSVGVSEDPQIGDTLQVNAYVALHSLTPEDVSVEVAYGRAEESDTLTDITVMELKVQEDLGSGRHLFSGSLVIDRSGPFGYTVRVLPRHDALASKAELGLIVNA
ncbi:MULTISPECIES: alpha-glucan family phosphorylase [Micrococcaceae]|uniref:alpha-glucan family phosphorylase n=1 Tax=Micrococcaceae TaxID=1268 RepID=UPI002AA7869C|nr:MULTISPECIES: alpha-glucan family phosphorylase [Pseudarthrobacter]MEA3552472.1 alpha-glucan family phosphorylase [Pseudarthrobacter sp. C1]WPU10142.1 alpha-glucan family phosphorylase [Pseudarthrobacter oxydans]HET7784274.1 alpha-glucan family phosphorylase [Arthrobacter sp.]